MLVVDEDKLHKKYNTDVVRYVLELIETCKPGSLVAEFEAEFRSGHDIAYSDEVAKMLDNKIWENQKVHILILSDGA